MNIIILYLITVVTTIIATAVGFLIYINGRKKETYRILLFDKIADDEYGDVKYAADFPRVEIAARGTVRGAMNLYYSEETYEAKRKKLMNTKL